jgi:hypothetical protein
VTRWSKDQVSRLCRIHIQNTTTYPGTAEELVRVRENPTWEDCEAEGEDPDEEDEGEEGEASELRRSVPEVWELFPQELLPVPKRDKEVRLRIMRIKDLPTRDKSCGFDRWLTSEAGDEGICARPR